MIGKFLKFAILHHYKPNPGIYVITLEKYPVIAFGGILACCFVCEKDQFR